MYSYDYQLLFALTRDSRVKYLKVDIMEEVVFRQNWSLNDLGRYIKHDRPNWILYISSYKVLVDTFTIAASFACSELLRNILN